MKTINFQISDELHREMRMEAILQDKSIKKYLTELIERDLRAKKEQTQ